MLNTIGPSEIISFLEEKLNPIFMKLSIDFAYLAGSYASGRIHGQSDLDIFVSLTDHNILDKKIRVELENQIYLEIVKNLKGIGIEIDLRVLEDLPLHIQMNVAQNGKVFFMRSEKLWFLYKEKLIREFNDYKIWRDQFFVKR